MDGGVFRRVSFSTIDGVMGVQEEDIFAPLLHQALL
jgi:hypothetical protein